MKKILIILLFITNPLLAENIGPIGNYNVNQLLQDNNLTYKVIKGCVSLNSAVTELIKKEHPDLANEFFKTTNFCIIYGEGKTAVEKQKKVKL
jgi:hypothetical protein